MTPPSVGLLDLAAPLFAGIDSALQVLPGVVRLVLWGLLAGVGSMLLYRLISPQRRIVAARESMQRARLALDAHDGDFATARPLLFDLLRHAGRQFAFAVPPALAAALPVAALMVWLGSAYGHSFPTAAAAVDVRVTPTGMSGEWMDSPPDGPRVRVVDEGDTDFAVFALQAPIPVLHRPRWWNVLVANPAGYVPADGAVERIDIGLPRQQHLRVGPQWLRGWEAPFFLAVLASALVARARLGIS